MARSTSVMSGPWSWLAVLPAAAAVVAIYLAASSLGAPLIAGCGSAGCEQAIHGRWSTWMGVPVSLLAACIYVVLTLLTLGSALRDRHAAARWLFRVLTLTAVLAAMWFIGLMVLVVHSVCPLCLTVHGCGLLFAVAAWFVSARRGTAAEPVAPGVARSRRGKILVDCVVALLLVGGLAAGQVVFQPRMFVEIQPVAGEAQASIGADADWLLRVASRTEIAEVDRLPRLGSPEAAHVLILFHQYTCPHCAVTHRALRAALSRYGDQIAVLLVPYHAPGIPCTSSLDVGSGPQAEICQYSRLALAVWRCRPDRYDEFDEFLLTPPSPMLANPDHSSVIGLAWARRRAEAIVGKQELKAALADPELPGLLAQLSSAKEQFSPDQKQIVPVLRVGQTTILGQIDETMLFWRLEQELKIKPVDGSPTQAAMGGPQPIVR